MIFTVNCKSTVLVVIIISFHFSNFLVFVHQLDHYMTLALLLLWSCANDLVVPMSTASRESGIVINYIVINTLTVHNHRPINDRARILCAGVNF